MRLLSLFLHVGVLAAKELTTEEWARELNVTFGTYEIPGIVKDAIKFKAAPLGGQGITGSMPFGGLQPRDLVAESIEARQQCPPGYPVNCGNGRCCSAAYPKCCSNGGCCDNAHPVCSGSVCCPTGMTSCGVDDPLFCHLPLTQCCGLGIACYTTDECCGPNCCNSLAGAKCCPGSSYNKNTCCGEYEVCCDGYCCPEGSTCTAGRPGYCTVPTLTFGWSQGSIANDLVENTCLGFRAQAARGDRPNVFTNGQILTYAGPGSNNRESTECRSGRNPRCCTGRVVPAGEPGAGDPMSCEEYPFNSVTEGGPGATCSCVNDYANKGAGDLIGAMVNGKHAGFKFLVEVVGIDCNTVTTADIHACN